MVDDDEEVMTLASQVLRLEGYVVLEAAERVRPLRPETKIMYMSGYPGDVIGKHGVLTSGDFVQKPLTTSSLVDKVREVFRTAAS